MNLTIGRVGLDVDVSSVEGWDSDGSRVSVSGQTAYGSVVDANVIRQQLLGYVDSPDESFVPVTWADEPDVDGFYRVLSVSVSPTSGGAFAGVYAFRVDLEKVSGFAAPLIECVALGAVRTSVLGVTKDRVQAVPVAARSYVEYSPGLRTLIPRVPEGVRVGEFASVNVFSGPQDYVVGQFYVPPASFYDGAATLFLGWPARVVVGRQVSNTPDSWLLSNDLVQMRPGVGAGFALEFRRWIDGAWSEWFGFTFSSQNFSDPREKLTAPHTITVLANSPEAVSIRLLSTAAGDYSPVMVDVTLRRGGLNFAVDLRSVFGSYFQVDFVAGTELVDAYTGGWGSTAAGPFPIVGSALESYTSGRTFRMGGIAEVSHEVLPFAVAVALGTLDAQPILNEYFWAGSEKQTVVAR